MSIAQQSSATETRRVSVREGYALWAASYDRRPNPLLVLEERVLEPMLPPVVNRHVLDVACGTGRWMNRLATRGAASVFGLDLSSQMLDRALKKASLRGRLLRADCRQIPILSGTIELALCSFIAGYLEDLRGLMRELSRLVTPQAEIFVSDVHPICHCRGWKRTFRHGNQVLEIENTRHSIADIVRTGETSGLRLVGQAEPHWGEPERRIFQVAGKVHVYTQSCHDPAIFILQFRPDSDTGKEWMKL